jgi:hypothetical protein
MEMRALMDLKEMLCKELDEITKKGELNAGGLDAAHKLTDTIKNIDKIMMLEDDDDGYIQRGGYGRGGDRGYSRAGEWEARGHFGRHGYDDHGSSYARRRDSRGRYSRADGMGGYSRDEGRHEMMETLEEMMSTAQGKDREIISRAMDELRRA